MPIFIDILHWHKWIWFQRTHNIEYQQEYSKLQWLEEDPGPDHEHDGWTKLRDVQRTEWDWRGGRWIAKMGRKAAGGSSAKADLQVRKRLSEEEEDNVTRW